MIGFDNGPKNGDYARYIDQLLADRIATLPSVPRPDLVDDVASTSIDTPGRARPAAAGRPVPAHVPTGDQRARRAPITPSQADAMATAVLARANRAGHATTRAPIDSFLLKAAAAPLVAVIVGAILVFTLTGAVAIVGLALVAWGISTLVKRLGTLRAQWAAAAAGRDADEAARIASIDWKKIGTRRTP